jgi:uncharacterized membrane protein YgcG
MNNNSALVVMMVFAYNDAALKNLQQIPVAKWFDQYQELLNSSPGDYAAYKWELVPGQIVYVQRPKAELDDVVGIVVFANFAKGGAGKAVIKKIGNQVIVTIGAASIVVDSSDADDSHPSPADGDEKATSGMNVSSLSKDASKLTGSGGSSGGGGSAESLQLPS